MFKHNYIQKLAYDNIRKQKKFYKFIFIALVLVFTLITMLTLLFASYEEIGYRERSQRYGQWSLVMNNPDEKLLNLVKAGNEIGCLYDMGNVTYQGERIGSLSSLDETAQKLTSLRLKEGRMPLHRNELVIEEEQFAILGLQPKINQTIQLTLDHQKTTQEYKIVGIVENYSLIYPIALGNFLTTDMTSNEEIVFVYRKDTLSLWNKIVELELYEDVQFNRDTYQYHQISKEVPFTQNGYTLQLQYTILFMGFIGVFGTMVSSITKRTEIFALMRSIGATSKQIQKMVMYEGMMLVCVSLVIGVGIGILAALLILCLYAYLLHDSLIFVVNYMFVYQLCLGVVISIIGMFIPSFEAYFIPMRGRIQPKVKKHKKRRIRKVSVPRLIIRELTDHKMTSFLLMAVAFVGIMSGNWLQSSITTYIYEKEKYLSEEYDHYLLVDNYFVEDDQHQVMSQSEIERLVQMKGVESQVLHSQNTIMQWDGIEEAEEMRSFRDFQNDSLNPNPDDLYECVELCYFENEDILEDMLKRHRFEGRLPQKEGEVIIVKPWIYVSEMGWTLSFLESEENKEKKLVYDVGLEIGDKVSFGEGKDWMEKDVVPIQDSFEIVGTMSFQSMSRTEGRLFSSNSYVLITNESTYHRYIQNDNRQLCMMNVVDKSIANDLKKEIYQIQRNHSLVEYKDVYADALLQKNIMIESIVKDVSFFGVLLTGVFVLTYLHRKIKVMGMSNEIGLYRAIGATKKQLYLIHFLYGFIIYFMTAFLFFSIILANYLKVSRFKEAFELLVDPVTVITVTLFGLGFVAAIFLPIYGQLKESILKSISSE